MYRVRNSNKGKDCSHNEEVLLSAKADRTASESVPPFLQLLGKHMRLWASGKRESGVKWTQSCEIMMGTRNLPFLSLMRKDQKLLEKTWEKVD